MKLSSRFQRKFVHWTKLTLLRPHELREHREDDEEDQRGFCEYKEKEKHTVFRVTFERELLHSCIMITKVQAQRKSVNRLVERKSSLPQNALPSFLEPNFHSSPLPFHHLLCLRLTGLGLPCSQWRQWTKLSNPAKELLHKKIVLFRQKKKNELIILSSYIATGWVVFLVSFMVSSHVEGGLWSPTVILSVTPL